MTAATQRTWKRAAGMTVNSATDQETGVSRGDRTHFEPYANQCSIRPLFFKPYYLELAQHQQENMYTKAGHTSVCSR
jgi:hypothetical protein